MNSKLTQIALDFGEPAPPPVPPPVANGNGSASGSGEEAARPYLAAGGVGVRVKSLKQPAPSPPATVEVAPEIATRPTTVKVVNGDLFGMAEPIVERATEPMMEQAPEPIVERAAEWVVEQASEPAVERAPERVVVDEVAEPEAVAEPAPVYERAAVSEPIPEAAPVAVAEPEPIAVPEPMIAVAPVEATPAEILPTTRRRTSPGRTTPAKPGTSKRGRKSMKEVAAEAHLIDIPVDEVLFSKQYYTMGEVSEMFRVNQSLLRFWETEFDILQPKKNKKGDRYFRPVDIKNLHLIYHLLRMKKYTIEGAKEFLKKNKKAEDRFEVIQRLEQIKAFLIEWKAQL
jgi:DNA-binding transcriptional MerR regulator